MGSEIGSQVHQLQAKTLLHHHFLTQDAGRNLVPDTSILQVLKMRLEELEGKSFFPVWEVGSVWDHRQSGFRGQIHKIWILYCLIWIIVLKYWVKILDG